MLSQVNVGHCGATTDVSYLDQMSGRQPVRALGPRPGGTRPRETKIGGMKKIMFRFARRTVQVACVVYLLIVILLMLFEEKLIFPAPTYPVGNWAPEHFEYEDVRFASPDGTQLHGWYLQHENPRGYLMYCHGNGDCVAFLDGTVNHLRKRHALSVFVFDYRGYGRSEGSPTEAGVLKDSEAALNWFADRTGRPQSEMILLGRSLGGGVAVDLAARHQVKAVVLQNTFTSMVDVAAIHYRWLPVRWLMRTKFDSLSKIDGYDGPVLQSHGTHDQVVPIELGRQLHAAIRGTKQFLAFDGGEHNSPEPAEYDAHLERFLSRVND